MFPASNPDTSVNWANFAPLAADPFFYYRNHVPYINNYMFSIQRQITSRALLTVSYVGNQGHRILAVASVNLGNPALCLSLPGCGPFGEDNDLYQRNRPDHLWNAHRTKQRRSTHRTRPKLRRKYSRQVYRPTPITTRLKPLFATSAAAHSSC